MGSELSTPNLVMGGATIAVGIISAALYQYLKQPRFAVACGHHHSKLFRRFWGQDGVRPRNLPGPRFLEPLGQSAPGIERIMIWDVYIPTLEFIENRAADVPAGRVIVSGHPGIGKSLFLYYILCQHLVGRKPTILQTENNVFYLFSDSGVQKIPSSFSDLGYIVPSETWALVDSNTKVRMPAEAILNCYSVFVVVAASSRNYCMEWDKARTPHHICMYYMEPWTLEELVAALPYQSLGPKEVPTVDQLQSFYHLYGPSAHDAYRSARQPGQYKEALGSAIDDMTGKVIWKAVRNGNLDSGGLKELHKVFMVQPSPEGDALPPGFSDRHEKMSVLVVSRYVMDLLWEAHEGIIWRDFIKHFQTTLQDPTAKAFAGQIFEHAAHSVLSSGGKFQAFKMTDKVKQLNTHWKKSAKTVELELQPCPHHLFLNINLLELGSKRYYQPIASNNQTFDSFIYDNGSDSIMILFQITVSHIHGVNEQGLHNIQEVRKKQLAGTQLWYIVVIPRQQEITITMQCKFYEAFIKEEPSFEMWAMVVDPSQPLALDRVKWVESNLVTTDLETLGGQGGVEED
ncbi:hypothetical protein FRB99_001988 [Tulasnella sp. 403]|nr:hypothetical protein FRB99_001988 [Tulasnella sp. 403]